MTSFTVDWRLTRAPDLGVTAWRAHGRCPHGATDHLLFGRAELVLNQANGLTIARRLQVGCSCPTGLVDLAFRDRKIQGGPET